VKGPLAADARTRTFSPMTTLVLALHLAATVPFAPKPIAPPPGFVSALHRRPVLPAATTHQRHREETSGCL
jgi:hypothetical protein